MYVCMYVLKTSIPYTHTHILDHSPDRIDIHPYTHTHIHPYIIHHNPYTHTPIHPYTIHPYTHTPIHPYSHTHIHPYTHTPIHPYTHTPILPYTHTPIHTHHYSHTRPLSRPHRRSPADYTNIPIKPTIYILKYLLNPPYYTILDHSPDRIDAALLMTALPLMLSDKVIYTYTYTHTYTHTHIYIHTHTHTHIYTHTHTHLYSL
jgi:hypothetical protein